MHRNGKTRTARVAGHFGELLQGRLGADGPVALVTLPCPALIVTARHAPGSFSLHQPGGVALTRARAARFLRLLGLPVRGRFVLHIPFPVGGGAGASTAALVALARAAGADEGRIIPACIAIEGASDPLMHAAPGRILWASRRGQVVAPMPALPRIEVLGGFLGHPRRTDAADGNFADIADLVAEWPAACRSIAGVARLAAESARRTLALRGPADDPTGDLARDLTALGFAIAHTGSARALLFAPGTVPKSAELTLRKAGFTRITRFRVGGGHA